MMDGVWVFNGAGGRFPGGIFTDKEIAVQWIRQHKLTGVLTLYPVNKGAFDWAIEKGFFTPKNDAEAMSSFIGKFSSASQEHYHYEDGELA